MRDANRGNNDIGCWTQRWQCRESLPPTPQQQQQYSLKINSPSRLSPHSPHSPIQGGNGGNAADGTARFSRKVFVGGLPPDIDEDEIWREAAAAA